MFYFNRKCVYLVTALVSITTWASAASAGTFRAIGTGTVILRSDTSTTFTLHGNGTFVVHDRTKVTIQASGSGQRKNDGNKVVFKNWTGNISVLGKQIRCRFSGGDVRLRAKGKGSCYVGGTGKFWVNGQGPTPWGEPKLIPYGQNHD